MTRRIFPALRHATALVCLYEAAAIWSRRPPTLSQLARRHPPVGPALLVALALHLSWPISD